MGIISNIKGFFNKSAATEEAEIKSSFEELKMGDKPNNWNGNFNEKDIKEIEFFKITKEINLKDGTFISKDSEFIVEGIQDDKVYLHFAADEKNKYNNEFGDDYICTLDELKEMSIPTEHGIEKMLENTRLEMELEEEAPIGFYKDKAEVEKPILEVVEQEKMDQWIAKITEDNYVKAENSIETVIVTSSPKIPGAYQMSCFLDKDLKELCIDRQFENINEVAKALVVADFKEVVEVKDLPYVNEYKSVYEYADCDVLKNKLDIKDAELLERTERAVSGARLVQLQDKPIEGNFDFNHLSKIHKFVFKDIYDWAGKPRTEEISKGNTNFAPSRYAVEGLKDTVFKPLKKMNYCRDMDVNGLSRQLGVFYCELNFAHPFREGNGRTQREFIKELAAYNGFDLDWKKADPKELMNATIGGTMGRNPELALDKLGEIIKDCFESLEPNKDLMKSMDKLLDFDRGR